MGRAKDKSLTEAENLRHQAEEMLAGKAPELHKVRSVEEMQRLVHELDVHHIELEMQNIELRESRKEVEALLDKYTDLFDFAPTGFCTMNRHGAILVVNLTLAGLLGVERSRLIGKRFELSVAPEDRKSFKDFLEKLYESGSRRSFETILITASTTRLFVQIEAEITGPDNNKECRAAVIDISARKQAELAMQQNKDRLEWVLEKTRIGTWYNELPLEHLDWDLRTKWLFFVRPDVNPTIGLFWSRVHPDDRENTRRAVDTAISERTIYEIDHRAVDPDNGEIRWIHSTGQARYALDGTPITFYGINYDITERKLAEEALSKSEYQLSESQRLVKLGSWQWDSIADNISGSKEFYRIIGCSVYRYSEFMELIHPDDREKVNIAVQKTLDHHLPLNTRYRIIKPDGSIIIIHAQGTFETDAAGAVIRMIGTAQDITEMALIEEALKDEQRKLVELNRMLEERISQTVEELRRKDHLLISQERFAIMGEMINNIAHQWRQPLNALGLTTQKLLLFYDSPEFDKEFLENHTVKSMNLIKQMSTTIDDFRNFFKTDKEKTIFSVNELIINTLSLLEPGLNELKIKIVTDMVDDVVVCGFPNEYSQVLLNIILNARDVLVDHDNIDDPHISIHAFSDGDNSIVTVSDNGGGIDQNFIGRLFDPYFTTRGPDKGTGIGLYMSKIIIEKNMGGRLTVRNAADGAEFRIEVRHGTDIQA